MYLIIYMNQKKFSLFFILFPIHSKWRILAKYMPTLSPSTLHVPMQSCRSLSPAVVPLKIGSEETKWIGLFLQKARIDTNGFSTTHRSLEMTMQVLHDAKKLLWHKLQNWVVRFDAALWEHCHFQRQSAVGSDELFDLKNIAGKIFCDHNIQTTEGWSLLSQHMTFA